MSTMGHALGYDAAPAFTTPARFFVTAPLFGVVAGLFLLVAPDLLASRWTPGALALTHLITVGFMLMIMVGALFQILPVVAGAVLPAANAVAAVVHASLTAGAAALVWGLAAMQPDVLLAAAWLLGFGFTLFFVVAAVGLWRAPVSQATPRDLRLALICFGIAIMLGLLLAMVLARGLGLPLFTLLKLHVGWAWLGGAGILLAATSWVVVPMFQITPNYPDLVTRYWAIGACTALVLWSVAVLADVSYAELMLVLMLLALAATYTITTLRLQQRSRKSTADSTIRAFQLGMASLMAGLVCVLIAHYHDHAVWPILGGVLILHGGFVSVIQGMLYKIVPFLAWLHLNQAGLKAPNMKKLQPDAPIRKQLRSHMVALAALVVAVPSGSTLLVRAAGILVLVEFAWLFKNMIGVIRAYRLARDA
ncbi:MAG TPA: hypothetical protein PL143_00525 [Rhodocyclaceae bacterium]|nr:hypothetical protein [Rhodocyclaceae bacterium]